MKIIKYARKRQI